jgi:hypothetical protein
LVVNRQLSHLSDPLAPRQPLKRLKQKYHRKAVDICCGTVWCPHGFSWSVARAWLQRLMLPSAFAAIEISFGQSSVEDGDGIFFNASLTIADHVSR